jgi:hypothetical protein
MLEAGVEEDVASTGRRGPGEEEGEEDREDERVVEELSIPRESRIDGEFT